MAGRRTQLELDLNSLLQLQSSDDDDDGAVVAHRTVDDILNDSADSFSSSSSSSPSSRSELPFRPLFPPKPEIDTREVPASEVDYAGDPEVPTADSPKSDKSEDKTSVISLPRSVFSESRLGLLRRKPGDGDISAKITPARGSSPLPSLFGVIKSNPRPGAALAAAAAASRSVPTPYAAAIKFKRTAIQRTAASDESVSSSAVKEEKEQELRNGKGEEDDKGLARRDGEEPARPVDRLGAKERNSSVPDAQIDEEVVKDSDGKKFVDGLLRGLQDHETLNGEVPEASVQASLEELNPNVTIPVGKDPHSFSESIEEGSLGAPFERPESVPANDVLIEPDSKLTSEMIITDSSKVEERKAEPSQTDAEEFADDRSALSDGKRSSKGQGKKSKPVLKPLEVAEELEKKNAFSGLHLEEGAAAQPMRLEGIRRGPPAVGYLQVNTDNAITHAISSETFRREHGTPQSLAVHMNYIAVGMSKGTVLVMPSKYSPHNADNLDSKVFILCSQGDKSHSPVTSLCFSQQGDLLLVGYGSGSLTVWDVQKGSAVKTIAEHNAPIIHTIFLGQDSQVTRQYKALTGDCKGILLLHTFSVFPLLNTFSVTTKCLLDGQRTETVLCASALLSDEFRWALFASGHGSASGSPGGLGSMMGGVVGGGVGGEAGWKLFGDGSPEKEGVVIFVTHQNALVVRLYPSLEVYAQLSRPDGIREGAMPYTAWKYVTDSSVASFSEELGRASLLAIAWDRKITVAKLVKSELKTLREWLIDGPAVGVAWLDDRMLVVLTLKGNLCLFTKEGDELYRTSYLADGSAVDDMIVYHTHVTNLFGNPEKACHNSIAVRGATIYVLGQVHLVTSRLLPWKERVRVLQKAGDWMGALDMAMKLYDGHSHGVIDLPRTTEAIRESIMPFLVELVTKYVDEVFSYISVAFCSQIEKLQLADAKANPLHMEINEQYARVGGVAVEFCVHISRIDILFDDIFTKFTLVQQGGTFLELLEPYILKDMLGCLPPEIMQALVEHYSRKGWLRRVEQCVLHMDISSLDFNQVVRLCREHGLYSALIYLFNRGLDDFRAPLEELLVVAQDSQRGDAVGIGYRMLVYLKYCFQGLAFPPGQGKLPNSRVPSLKKELIEFLLENSSNHNSQFVTIFKSSLGSCLNLYYLLWLDTEATLEVLRCAFFESESQIPDHPSYELGDMAAKENQDGEIANKTEDQTLMSQNITNALIRVLDIEVPGVDKSSSTDAHECLDLWPSKKERGHLLEFIACFVVCQQATVAQNVINRILVYLTSETDTSTRSAGEGPVTYVQQKQVLALLEAVPKTQWDSSFVLQICEQAQYYQVCSLIHRQRGQHVAALDCYIKDMNEPIHAFAFISNMLLQLKDAECLSFKSAVVSRMPELVKLSREGTFFLVIEHFSKETEQMLSILQPHPKCLFLYLKTAVEVHLFGALNFTAFTKEDILVSPFYGLKFTEQSEELRAYLQRLSSFPKLICNNSIDVTDKMAELYLELLCQFEPGSVLSFLQTYDNYRLEHCLRLCQEYGVTDAAAFLLERAGDVGSSLTLILSGINSQLDNIYSIIQNKVTETTTPVSESEQLDTILNTPEVTSLCNILRSSIGLCQRNTSRLDSQESESLWFHLLDSFCKPLRHLFGPGNVVKSVRNNSSGIEDNNSDTPNVRIPEFERAVCISRRMVSQFVREIIEGMVGYIPLPTIMTKLLSDNGGQHFGDFKATILGMLGTYGYERRILDTAKILIEDDTYYIMSLLKKGASHAYALQSCSCCVCGSLLTKEPPTSGVHLFHCGHAVHVQCEVGGSDSNKDSVECPICMPKKNPSRARSKSILVEDGLVKNSPSRSQHRQGSLPIQPLHESDLIERPYGLQQMSRFDILKNLQKVQRTLQIDTLPRLRLAPPAIYHEKVKMTPDVSIGEGSSSAVKNEKRSRFLQLKNLKPKASSFQFPLRSTIFVNEKNRR
ncbi:unnamed protein product [Victoria cruziana]